MFVPRKIFPRYNISLADFKGHHVKALTKLTHLAPQIDMVLEVRDSRAPISTRNVLFDKPLQGKEKIVLYSKNDLSGVPIDLLKKWHNNKERFMMIDCRNGGDMKRLIQMIREKHDRMHPKPPLGVRVIITGMPNVGKSTLVNTLRKIGLNRTKNVARTGGQPGVTRSTSEIIRVHQNPEILVYDTPGVFLPKMKDVETMMSLALVGTIKPIKIDPVMVADYLLFVLNLQDPTGSKYRKYIKHPTNDIYELLEKIAERIKRVRRTKNGIQIDEIGSSLHFIDEWKQGRMGKCLFDLDAIKEIDQLEFQENYDEERLRVNYEIKPKVNRQANASNALFEL